ncbi:hypothetical protein LJC58_06350 [Lachnospiraceae bacterium OttesenSCG-928-D06]|nr:hypothetical protein [Lachnospiraceae bacterium OttesenSCG-928-D06]
MIEQELLDMIVQERVDMLPNNLRKNKPTSSAAETKRTLQTERIIDNLPDDERKLVQNYIDNYTDLFASSEPLIQSI